MTTATLLLTCPDRRGLVAAVSEFVFRHGGNIVHAEQHNDQEEGVFFQRVEFEIDGFSVGRDEIHALFEPLATDLGLTWRLHFSDDVPRVAVLVSKEPHCLVDLLTRWRMGELRGHVAVVASNHADLAGIAGQYGIPFHHYPVSASTKAAQETRLTDLFDSLGVDLVVMARYMQILTPGFCDHFRSRIINIHHSFLPAFPGGRPYHQAHLRGVKLIGATAHYATADLDEGPIIDQDVVRVSHRDAVSDLVRKGRDLEKVVLARAVRAHLEHKVLVYGNKTVVFE